MTTPAVLDQRAPSPCQQVNMQRLRENLSREEGRSVGTDEVEQWLRDAQLRVDGATWIVREADLGQLGPSEVMSVEDVLDSE